MSFFKSIIDYICLRRTTRNTNLGIYWHRCKCFQLKLAYHYQPRGKSIPRKVYEIYQSLLFFKDLSRFIEIIIDLLRFITVFIRICWDFCWLIRNLFAFYWEFAWTFIPDRGSLARVAKWRSPPGPHFNFEKFRSDCTHLRPGHALRAFQSHNATRETKVSVRPWYQIALIYQHGEVFDEKPLYMWRFMRFIKIYWDLLGFIRKCTRFIEVICPSISTPAIPTRCPVSSHILRSYKTPGDEEQGITFMYGFLATGMVMIYIWSFTYWFWFWFDWHIRLPSS